MRKLTAIVAVGAFALAAVLISSLAIVSPVDAQTVHAMPDRGDVVQRATGKLIDLSGGNSTTTTYDVWDFGFTSDMVMVCPYPGSATVYLRPANAVTNVTATFLTSLTAQRATAPVSTSAAFITGENVYGSGALSRALPLLTHATAKDCTTFPLRTPGLVAHVVSGLATVEAWAVSR